jgi:tetratricopeptide (TPR) repeat protein
MTDQSRIDDLRRRVQKDPASIAFAQLAEECRRAGQLQEALDACRSGLAIHPGYLSARVTLGRALLQLGRFDEARTELEQVRGVAPDNLAAVRGLAELQQKCGALQQALAFYQIALGLAPSDPELERTVTELSRHIVERADHDEGARTAHLLSTLEQWLAATHVTRAQRRA